MKRTATNAIRALTLLLAVPAVAFGVESHGLSTKARPVSASESAANTSYGLTTPTRGEGTRVKGGTVYLAEGPGAAPNYIFPMYSAQYCDTQNTGPLIDLLYRPLYWFGQNYSPTVDYGQSIGKQPVVSNGGRTYIIHLSRYRWSDGERVTADDVVFWMNMLEADAQTGWCHYAPGYFPSNVSSYKAVNASTFQLTFKKRFNPTWVIYNELSQITPLPLAWDRTSLSQAVPKQLAGSIGATPQGAGKVYKFLSKAGAETASWAGSPLWRVVDGPFQLASFTSTGRLTLVANHAYAGSPKPSIASLVEVPFTSDAAEVNEVRASGPAALTIASLPAETLPVAATIESEGYELNPGAAYGFNALELNMNNPTAGPIFRQLYFRQATAHLIDQPGWIKAILGGAAVPDYGPVATEPASPLLPAGHGANPYPFSISSAAALLKANGWKVVPRGTSYCVKPGTGTGECGAGIRNGEKLAFAIAYETGVVAVQSEMQDLQSKARQVGMTISLKTATFSTLVSYGGPCKVTQAVCSKLEGSYINQFTVYGTGDAYPTGEEFFLPGVPSNGENYSNAEMNKLIEKTITAPTSQAVKAMDTYLRYQEEQEPLIFMPYEIGTFTSDGGTLIAKRLGGYAANAFGGLDAQYWYLTK